MVSNYHTKGNPIFPLVGFDSADIMTSNTPVDYRNKTRFFQINHLLISKPSNSITEPRDIGSIIIKPYSVVARTLYDTRSGGYGLFFFEALILSIIGFIRNFLGGILVKYWQSQFFFIYCFMFFHRDGGPDTTRIFIWYHVLCY